MKHFPGPHRQVTEGNYDEEGEEHEICASAHMGFSGSGGLQKNEGTSLSSAPVFDNLRQTFTIILTYGYGDVRGNVIDAVDNRLVKDLLNGKVVEVNDFVLTPEERKAIYEGMLLAGYQGK